MQQLETHWTRSLYYDFFNPDTSETLAREPERIASAAADGYPLTGTCYAATGPTRAEVPRRVHGRFEERSASGAGHRPFARGPASKQP